jgi:hypothetical protein
LSNNYKKLIEITDLSDQWTEIKAAELPKRQKEKQYLGLDALHNE